jgi:hypothetical protein
MKKEDLYIKMKIADATIVPEGFVHILKDRWWSTDGENILFFRNYDSPQCNSNKEIAEQIAANHKGQVVFMPLVYLPHNCNDYSF